MSNLILWFFYALTLIMTICNARIEETRNNEINDNSNELNYDREQRTEQNKEPYKGRSTNNEINDYIYGLNYDRDQVLAYKGEIIRSIRKKEGRLDETNTFIVITREIKTIDNRKADIGVLTTNEHKTYPGSLLLANYHLLDNSPDIIAIGRSPLKYTINLPGLTTDGSFEITPSFANYQSNLNRVLNLWFNRYPQGHVNAVFQSDYSLAYSKEQLRVKFGTEFKFTDVESDVDFDSIHKQEKLIVIHRFKQIYYTVSVEPPNEPADLFASNVTLNELSRKTDSKNPPLLVDSVSYGRVIYVKIETSSTDEYAKDILQNKINRFDHNDTDEYIKQLNNFNMQVYVMGGGTEHIDLITAKTVEEVNKIIVKHGKFDKDNLGFPLSYASQFLKDNSFAIVRSSTDYTESRRTEYQKGIVEVIHRGWYVAKWVVEWDERSYDNNGNEIRNRKGWENNYHSVTAPFVREIELGGNCDNIYVKALDKTGLVWEQWRTVIERSGIPLIEHRKFSIWGTTLFPARDIDPKI